jgi:rhodanese-related sulfurtransferase
MIRDRLKSVARRAAIKLLNMEFDTEDRDPAARRRGDPSQFDPSKIPPLVDGDGDTPGPNHKTEIGRTWVSAQLAGGVAPFFLDIRPPLETVAGILPGAIVLPNELVLDRLDLLPSDRDERITIYDQTGALDSESVAMKLREAGFSMARSLRGGYAEWIEHAETVQTPEPPSGATLKIGDPFRMTDGREGWVMRTLTDDGQPTVEVWFADGTWAGPVSEDAVQA